MPFTSLCSTFPVPVLCTSHMQPGLGASELLSFSSPSSGRRSHFSKQLQLKLQPPVVHRDGAEEQAASLVLVVPHPALLQPWRLSALC